MPEIKFSVGNIVQLKSGGPVMTISDASRSSQGDPMVEAVWFDEKDQLNKGMFYPETLNLFKGAGN